MSGIPALVACSDEEADRVLVGFWDQVRQHPRLVDLAALLPQDRALGLLDVLPMVPLVMAHLATPRDQLQVLDALSSAYLRATENA